MNKLLKNIILVLSLLLAGMTTSLQAADLYAIIVGDTDAYDVRPFIEQDIRLVREEMGRVAYYTGMNLKEMVFVNEHAKGSFLAELDKLNVQPEDVIVFYWNGHGKRDEKSAWPKLIVTETTDSIDHWQLTQKLMEKNPRFLLSIAASCNRFDSEMKVEKSEDALLSSNDEAQIEKNYRTLFLEQKGVWIASSTAPGEYSWINPEKGAEYYTLALLDRIHDSVENGVNVKWETILDETTEEMADMQTPHYTIISKK